MYRNLPGTGMGFTLMDFVGGLSKNIVGIVSGAANTVKDLRKVSVKGPPAPPPPYNPPQSWPPSNIAGGSTPPAGGMPGWVLPTIAVGALVLFARRGRS